MNFLPLSLTAYRLLTGALSPLAKLWLKARAKKGKEDAAGLDQRLGLTDLVRPDGKLVWLHGASVGEAEIALGLMQTLHETHPDTQFLLTSGTVTSAALITKRLSGKSTYARHHYIPLDCPQYARRFIDHWRPELGVFIESEIWPNLILRAHKNGTKLALVNARMNARSLRQWQRAPMAAARLLSAFSWIGAADAATANGLQSMAAQKIIRAGNLKLGAPAPQADAAVLTRLKSTITNRPVWLAVSTHKGEDDIMLAAHASICAQQKDALMILVPRHPERAANIAALCAAHGLIGVLHSAGPLSPNTQVYIGDSIGEMGLWLRLGGPVFIGGSLSPDFAGHNPIEAAKLRTPILTGPHHASFAALYTALMAKGGAKLASNADEISDDVTRLWKNPAGAQAMTNAAFKIVQAQADAPMKTTLVGILPLLERGDNAST